MPRKYGDHMDQTTAKAQITNNTFNDEETEIDLIEIIKVLWNKALLIILGVVICGGAAFGISKFLITPQYTAKSTIYVFTKTTSITSLADINLGSALAVDFTYIGQTRDVVESVIDELRLNTTYEQLSKSISITNPDRSHLLEISVTDVDPVAAANISNSLADHLREAIADVMTTDKPSMVQRAVIPQQKSSPNNTKNAIIGALIGFALVAGIVIARHLMDDTIKTDEDVEKYLHINTLASFPYIKTREDKEKKGGKSKGQHKAKPKKK